jgi:hypothetical protein
LWLELLSCQRGPNCALRFPTCGTIWICEMTNDETDPQQSDDMDLLVEVFDEALEAACGELARGFPTLAYGSYCFTCRHHLY